MSRHIIDQPHRRSASRVGPYLMLDAQAATHPVTQGLRNRRASVAVSGRRVHAFLDILRRNTGSGLFRRG